MENLSIYIFLPVDCLIDSSGFTSSLRSSRFSSIVLIIFCLSSAPSAVLSTAKILKVLSTCFEFQAFKSIDVTETFRVYLFSNIRIC